MMQYRTRFAALFVMLAMLFSNLATAAMWCCQAGQHHQHAMMQPLPDPGHNDHQHHDHHAMPEMTDTDMPSVPHSDHQNSCPSCAVSCHFALVMPVAEHHSALSGSEQPIELAPEPALSFQPLTPHRPPIA